MIYEIYAILYLYKRGIGEVMKSDIEIAQSVTLKPITEIVEKVGISFDDMLKQIESDYGIKLGSSV